MMEEEARPATGQAGELRLLFLDIDGVISIDLMHNTLHEEALVQLGRIVTTTAAKIVLSSTWRRSEHGMAHLNENFEKRGIGTIFSITPPEMGRTRAQEIMKWHEMHMPILKDQGYHRISWVAVDDVDLLERDRENMLHHSVKTDPKVGMLKEHADKVIALLMNKQET